MVDGIFLLKVLSVIGKVTPIVDDGRIVSIDVEKVVGNKTITLTFRDSLQLMSSSLRSLATSFNLESKGILPYSFANKNNLNYVGAVPDISYYNNISLDQYNNYKKIFKIIGVLEMNQLNIVYLIVSYSTKF